MANEWGNKIINERIEVDEEKKVFQSKRVFLFR